MIADIGTDHAYLPIWLAQNLKITGAAACDISYESCVKAEKNIKKYALEEKIKVVRTDGLNGVEKYAPNDIIIAGMGGELIIGIISDNVYIRNINVRLILQPMTRQPLLREYLIRHDFDIIGEALTTERGRIYQTICAVYKPVSCAEKDIQMYSGVELIAGKQNIINRPPLFCEFVKRQIKQLETKINGKKNAGQITDTEFESALLKELKELL